MKKEQYYAKKSEAKHKVYKRIWKALHVEQVCKEYGTDVVKQALNKWVTYQRDNARLLKDKKELEARLKEIEAKL